MCYYFLKIIIWGRINYGNVHVSVVIPAHNEEKYVKRCIDSIKRAAKVFRGNVEIIIVCNRCDDRTAEIAMDNGAVVIENEDKCIALVRNAGINSAKGREKNLNFSEEYL